MVSENCVILVYQRIKTSGKCELRWKWFAIDHRKRDRLAGRATLDYGSLAVDALGNEGTGTENDLLLGSGRPRKEHHWVSATHLGFLRPTVDIQNQGFVNGVWVYHVGHVEYSGRPWNTGLGGGCGFPKTPPPPALISGYALQN